MPLDPMIARGVTVPNPGNALLAAEELQNRRDYNNVLMQRTANEQQQYQSEQQNAAEEAEIRMLAPLVAKGDPGAVERMAQNIDRHAPGVGDMFRQNPAAMLDLLQQQGVIEAPPAPIEYQKTPWNGYVTTQGGQFKGQYTPPAPPQYGPESFSPQTMADGTVVLIGNRGTIRPTDLKGQSKAGGEAKPEGGMNDRQRAGANMVMENAIAYAANITGSTRDQIRALLATEGPAGVEKLILEKGKRSVQGPTARVLSSFPLGKTIVEASNPDLIAPGKGGGAGIALVQNPAGMITKADFEAGEAQFPNATYPLETQAAMVRQMMESNTSAPPATSADPLANVEVGAVIKQGGKRYLIIQGQDGRKFAQELK